MSTRFSITSAKIARASSPATSFNLSTALGDQLATLYDLAQRSDYVFGSPLGPFYHGAQPQYLPRFVYFGPHTSAESPRLAFLAGHDSRDLRPTLALLHLVEELALKPDLGQSLHLAFYPLIDVLGHLQRAGQRDLVNAGWGVPAAPEIDLLAKDSRLRAYHAFIRIESAPPDDAVTLRLRTTGGAASTLPPVSSADTEPFPVRWEVETGPLPAAGPLSLGDDLPFYPFELTLRVPIDWSPEFYRLAVSSILQRFIVRYRGFLAYGQHL